MQAVHPGAGSQAQNQKAVCLVSHKATLTVLVSVQVGPPFLSCACFFRLKWLPKEAFHRVLCLPVSSSGCHPPDLELSCPVGLTADVGLSLTQHLSADQLVSSFGTFCISLGSSCGSGNVDGSYCVPLLMDAETGRSWVEGVTQRLSAH